MIPRNARNRKARVNLLCPTCGMNLQNHLTEGFVLNNETFCCLGCAEGTGCTCAERGMVPRPKAGNRRGDIGHRNAGNRIIDNSYNEEIDSSGKVIGPNKQETRKGPRKYESRGQRLADGRKAPRSQSETRDSSRVPARGRSEFRGRMTKGRKTDRISKTATKTVKPGEL